jgi:hypothetical protein
MFHYFVFLLLNISSIDRFKVAERDSGAHVYDHAVLINQLRN